MSARENLADAYMAYCVDVMGLTAKEIGSADEALNFEQLEPEHRAWLEAFVALWDRTPEDSYDKIDAARQKGIRS